MERVAPLDRHSTSFVGRGGDPLLNAQGRSLDLEKVAQSLVQIGVLKAVTELQRPFWHGALAAAQHLAELAAEFEVEDESGDRHERRPAERLAERLGELAVAGRGLGEVALTTPLTPS